MKIILLGKNGMLGSYFLKYLTGKIIDKLYAFDKSELDILDHQKMREVFEHVDADFILNCTAYTDVAAAEENSDLAFKLNAEAPGVMADLAKKNNAKLIHFSSDYVFDGEKGKAYLEEDTPNPINIYGESKFKGEEAIKSFSDNYHIIRTAWLYGPGGNNFVDKMLSLGREKGELKVVDDQIGSPTYTHDLVLSVFNDFMKLEKESGIYHLVNEGEISWFDLASKALEFAKVDAKIEAVKSDVFPSPAKRPAFSALKSSKVPLLRPWNEALGSYIEGVSKN